MKKIWASGVGGGAGGGGVGGRGGGGGVGGGRGGGIRIRFSTRKADIDRID